jgi:hypothetical protein
MRTLYSRVGTALVALLGVGALVMVACSQASEGDRCNPDLNSGNPECNGGLTCTPAGALCPESYCCPTLADGGLAPSSNPNCQPGCNGGAASICNAVKDAGDPSCVWACQNDQGDLSSPSTQCVSSDGGGGDGGLEAAPEASGGDSGGGGDSGHEAAVDGGKD